MNVRGDRWRVMSAVQSISDYRHHRECNVDQSNANINVAQFQSVRRHCQTRSVRLFRWSRVKIINFLSLDFVEIFQKKMLDCSGSDNTTFRGREKFHYVVCCEFGTFARLVHCCLVMEKLQQQRATSACFEKAQHTKKINEQHWNLRFFHAGDAYVTASVEASHRHFLPGPKLTSFTNHSHRHFRFKSNFVISDNFTCRDAPSECLWSSPNI